MLDCGQESGPLFPKATWLNYSNRPTYKMYNADQVDSFINNMVMVMKFHVSFTAHVKCNSVIYYLVV